ncbi:O-antigen ligase family protein [Polynucleobacter sp. JS-JIR-II-b4]|jgi:hypothetical protein|uniref:O-antigen ligase family protein n=1 Tax=Polynucleobacter sp. JS-JIR-II-b4 TaxID=1758390 RepID=UPI001BFDA8C3|nr:O-antigen ligase family protein [Polynucleobacter sp. JS-JIR-II-b4]QWE02823.1 O-antigen ligase family protein [Polynucleobacter sp. JS-JIR-II-b4]
MIISNALLGQQKPKVPNWVIWVQCIAFVALYAVWILPEVVGVRNTTLIVGALFGAYVIFQYKELFLKKNAFPGYFLLMLFAWATLHLLFISHDFNAQWREYLRIWKYAVIGFIFALGLGLSLAMSRDKKYWNVIYFGMCIPVTIYVVKFLLTTYGPSFGYIAPNYLQIYQSSAPFYIPKSDYIPFCLPALAIALGEIKHILQTKQLNMFASLWKMLPYLVVIFMTLLLFYVQTMKNGFLYVLLCVIVFVGFLLFEKSTKSIRQRIFLALAGVLITSVVMFVHVQQNAPWKALMADAKIAIQLDKYDNWKYNERKGLPKNEFGLQVFGTNYQRIAWGIAGTQLSLENPLGYGLIEDSFSKLAKEKWPDSVDLSHTHSGWLDIALAIGLPGLALILMTLLMLIWQSFQVSYPWGGFVFWSLLSILFLWITTEAAQTITFVGLIFWLSFCTGLVQEQSCQSDSLRKIL